MRGALLTLLTLVAASVSAQTEIHRCLQEDGTIAFQEMPCPEPARITDDQDVKGGDQLDAETTVPADSYSDFVNPFDAPENVSVIPDTESDRPVSQDRATCEKTSRDAIDAIDLEMREGYTKEQGERYLSDLLVLTKQLRACKQL
ncbi:MAG: hypothetical protein ACR2Q3_04795 [Woeseiaceae bacterium]